MDFGSVLFVSLWCAEYFLAFKNIIIIITVLGEVLLYVSNWGDVLMDAFTGSFRRHKFGLHVLFVSVGMVQIAVGFYWLW